MFELIGVLVVGWFALKFVNRFLENAVVGMQIKAVDYARALGVPEDFAVTAAADRDKLKMTVQHLKYAEFGFDKLRGHECYGRAIAYLYERHIQVQEEEARREAEKEAKGDAERRANAIKDSLFSHLAPQLQALEVAGVPLNVSEVTYAYVAALAGAMTKQSINLAQIHLWVEQVFRGKAPREVVQNAYMIALQAPEDFCRKMAALVPVAERELTAGHGDYLVKFAKKAHAAFERMFTDGESFDPTEQTLESYLGLDEDAADASRVDSEQRKAPVPSKPSRFSTSRSKSTNLVDDDHDIPF